MKLPHRITIQAYTESGNEYGETEKDWADYITAFANVRMIKATENFSADQEQARVDLTVRLRNRPWLTAQHRIKWKGNIYEIAGPPVDVDGTGRFVELACHDLNKA
ncbi:phage head closure protein [Neptuniibacter sp.]|uniref:phage head closure protein n=1 Tax=Neptuniibacter sp. TaxID=1962643 RepID=UPI0026134C20|nr:phage head closure protein [Neptuniibacter sp.]MCP4595756.1 phage head closure protein [Neptuniibacter sp.]